MGGGVGEGVTLEWCALQDVQFRRDWRTFQMLVIRCGTEKTTEFWSELSRNCMQNKLRRCLYCCLERRTVRRCAASRLKAIIKCRQDRHGISSRHCSMASRIPAAGIWRALRQWAICVGRFGGKYCWLIHHLPRRMILLAALRHLNMTALHSFEISGTN